MRRFNDGGRPPNVHKTGFFRRRQSPQNLDAPRLSPYTSAAPLMDVILNPRAARNALFGGAGDGRGFEDVAAL
jgi:hypothetical protein